MKNEQCGPHKAYIFGMDANTLAALSYWAQLIFALVPGLKNVAFIAPILIYFIENQSSFVKFHAMQCLFLNLFVWAATYLILFLGGGASFAPAMANPLAALMSLPLTVALLYVAILALWIARIVATIKAAQYKEYHIFLIGEWAATAARTN